MANSKVLLIEAVIVLSLACLVTPLIAQEKLSRKEKLQRCKASVEEYIPENVKDYEVLFINLDSAGIVKREKKAHYLSFLQNGIDTTSQPDPFRSDELTSIHQTQKMVLRYFTKKVRGKLNVKIINAHELSDYDVNTYRYLVDVGFSGGKETPQSLGFVISADYFFVDRRTGRVFKALRDNQITILDLLD